MDSKPWYQSKGIVGAITAGVPALALLLSFVGVDIKDLAGPLSAGLLGVLGLVGTVVAIIGRCKAWKTPNITLTSSPGFPSVAITVAAVLAFSLTTATAGVDVNQPLDPAGQPKTVVTESSSVASDVFKVLQGASDNHALEVVVAPSYTSKLPDNPFGIAIALLHPIGAYGFVGVRGDLFDGNVFFGSASAGLKATINLTPKIALTPIAYAGAVYAVSGAGDKTGDVAAQLGTGLSARVWRNEAKNVEIDAFGALEYWSNYPGIATIRGGVMVQIAL